MWGKVRVGGGVEGWSMGGGDVWGDMEEKEEIGDSG